MSSGMNRSRILVVDSVPVLRAGIIHWLEQEPDPVCCGTAASMAAARREAVASRPDLVILDLDLPDGDGLDLLREFSDARPVVRALVFSAREEAAYAQRALRAGARGYLTKHAGKEVFVEAIRTVLSGQIHVSQAVKADLAEHLFPDPVQAATTLHCLSDREHPNPVTR